MFLREDENMNIVNDKKCPICGCTKLIAIQ